MYFTKHIWQQHKVIISSALVLYLLVVLLWFRGSQAILFWDQTYPLRPSRAIFSALKIWDPSQAFGTQNVTQHALLLFYISVFILNHLLVDPAMSQAFLYAGILLLSLFGWQRLTVAFLEATKGRSLLRESYAEVAGLCAGLFCTFNTYNLFYEWRIVNTAIFLQASLPWLLYNISKLCSDLVPHGFPTRRYWIGLLISLLFLAPGLSNPLMIGVTALPVLAFVLILRHHLRWQRLLPVAVLCTIAQTYWLIPDLANATSLNTQISYGGHLTALISNSSHISIINLFRFTGMLPVWENYKGTPDYSWAYIYAGHGYWSLFLLLPLIFWLVIFISWLRNQDLRRPLLLLLSLVAVSMILTSGTNGPFGAVYEMLFNKVPFFSGYRDPYLEFGFAYFNLFGLLLGFGTYGILCTRGAALSVHLTLRDTDRRDFKRANYLWEQRQKMFVLGMVFIIGGFSWPLFSGEVIHSGDGVRPSARVQFPRSFSDISRYLRANDRSGYAVLALPLQATPLESENWRSGYVGLDPLQNSAGVPVMSVLPGTVPEQLALSQIVTELADHNQSALNLASALGIHYILFRWDNNYKFGGVENISQMRSIYSWLLGKQFGVSEYSSSRMSLLALESRQVGVVESASQAVPSARVGSSVSLSLVGKSASSGKPHISFASFPRIPQLSSMPLQPGTSVVSFLTTRVFSNVPSEFYFAGAVYVDGRYQSGKQWFPYAVTSEGLDCESTSAGWVEVRGSCVVTFVSSSNHPRNQEFNTIELVTRSVDGKAALLLAENVKVTEELITVPGMLSAINSTVSGFVDVPGRVDSSFLSVTAASRGVTTVGFPRKYGESDFVVVVPQAFNSKLRIDVGEVDYSHVLPVECPQHVVIDGFLDGWVCRQPLASTGVSTAPYLKIRVINSLGF